MRPEQHGLRPQRIVGAQLLILRVQRPLRPGAVRRRLGSSQTNATEVGHDPELGCLSNGGFCPPLTTMDLTAGDWGVGRLEGYGGREKGPRVSTPSPLS